MRTMWRSIVAAGFVIGCGASTALAQAVPVSLSLEDALARGKATAPRLAEAVARQEAAAAIVTSREALKQPSLTASAAYQRTNHVDQYGIPQPDGSIKVLFPDIPNNYRGRADASMALYTGGRVESLVSSAK